MTLIIDQRQPETTQFCSLPIGTYFTADDGEGLYLKIKDWPLDGSGRHGQYSVTIKPRKTNGGVSLAEVGGNPNFHQESKVIPVTVSSLTITNYQGLR